ncbi:ThiF family adenylyltransferase [Nocardia carnea]|uniref:ThiF family adenylyltransferase n=1 Tax=Nocardia carnea TaxID=37328 RepID=UPI0024541C56|nr:ThiF family adenylyltransferase [Nocardia carnea]
MTNRSARPAATDFEGSRWHIRAVQIPVDGGDDHEKLLAGLRELRARILFDRGRRPAFGGVAEDCADDQQLDYGAWHFLASRDPDGPPLGYIRLSTPATGHLFQSLEYLGPEQYRRVLADESVDAAHTFEHSRLVVEHRARKLGLGTYLNALAIGAAHHLGARLMIGTSGTADGQERFHARFGFVAVPGTRRYTERYTEDVIVMVQRPTLGAGEYTELVAATAREFPTLPTLTATGDTVTSAARDMVREAPTGLSNAPRPDETSWQPTLFEPVRAQDHAALTELLESGRVQAVFDSIGDQLDELVRCREPHRRFTPDDVAAAVREQLDGVEQWAYGTWAWYPWSGRLVHVLPCEEFRLVRTDRNREKIQRPQQRLLFARRIGIAGLSVGNSAALTLTAGGIGGHFRLADFDELGLSNLNRLRAGLHHLGVNKAVLCARQMFEVDPYLDIEIFTGGLTEENIDRFFDGLDLMVEECDTPKIKLAAREYARERRIPVVMDCNDRGMLDIERFDLEPDRPLLHGRLGAVGSAELDGLTPPERAEVMLAMVDPERISPELAAAFGQIGVTLSTWPQLAADVALGGALVADAARRILLGLACESGRFYVDLAELIAPEHNTAVLAGTTQ